MRGSATQRGYDYAHQRERARAIARLTHADLCPMCRQPLKDGSPLEYEHSTPRVVDSASRANRLVHARCNPRGTSPLNYREH